MLPVQAILVMTNHGTREVLAVWDSGSTTNIMEAQTAEAAGWKKRPTELKYTVARGDVKEEDMFWYQVPMITTQGHMEYIWARYTRPPKVGRVRTVARSQCRRGLATFKDSR